MSDRTPTLTFFLGMFIGLVLAGAPLVHKLDATRAKASADVDAAKMGEAVLRDQLTASASAAVAASDDARRAKAEANEANSLSKSLIDNAERVGQAHPAEWNTAGQLGACFAVLVHESGNKNPFAGTPEPQTYEQLLAMRDTCMARLQAVRQYAAQNTPGPAAPQIDWPQIISMAARLFLR